jgi:hypothetical protein
MFNPLAPNLDDYSIDDLTKRLSQLNARLSGAIKSGNPTVAQQVRVLIMETSEELAKRNRDLMKKTQEEMNKGKEPVRKDLDPENTDPMDIGE